MCGTEAMHRNGVVKIMSSEECRERTVQHPWLRAGAEAEDIGGDTGEGSAVCYEGSTGGKALMIF